MTNAINPQNPHERYDYEKKGQLFRRHCDTCGSATMHRYEGQVVNEPDRHGIDLSRYRIQGLATCMGPCKSTISFRNRTLVQDREIMDAMAMAA